MKKILLLAVIALSACTREKDATRALESMGMTDIRTTGYRLFGCGEADAFRTGFVATSTNGRQVTGVVCSGWLKGSTVRFD